jgi:putative MATE family efflux protein
MNNSMQKPNRNVLDTDRIGWLLVKLATPAFFGMFVQTLYNVVNTIFIGHFVGPLAIAGLSIVFPLQMLCMGIGMMVGLGGTSLISRYLGAGDIPRAERTLGNGITCSIILSLLLTAIIVPNVNFWLRLIGASEEVLPFAREYLIIIFSGTVFNVAGMALLNYVRGEGNARVGMIANMIGAILNIILDSILIILLHMGVKGAALGTVIAQIVTLIYLASYYLTGSSYLKIRKSNLPLDFKILKSMFSIGTSSFVQTIGSSISAMFLIRMVVTYGGDIALSAFGILQRVMMFAMMPAMVIGQGVQPILGFNYGARRYSLALKALTIAYIASTILSILGFVVLYFIPEPIIKIFSTDPQLVATGTFAAKLIFLSMPLMGFVMVGTTSFQSIGKAMQAFITAIARPVVFLIPSVMILPRFLQLKGVFLSFPASDALTFVLTIILITPIIREFRKAAATEKQGKTDSIPSNRLLDSTQSSRTTK